MVQENKIANVSRQSRDSWRQKAALAAAKRPKSTAALAAAKRLEQYQATTSSGFFFEKRPLLPKKVPSPT